MKTENLSLGARVAMGEHSCKLYLRPVGEIPGGLWSWSVYVDGNVHSRGPGSKRKDPDHWYAALLPGEHRVVVREASLTQQTEKSSNTLRFTVSDQTEIVVAVSFMNGEIDLKLSPETSACAP